MKLMKKALALFIAVVMIFSTMAIGVSATESEEINFSVKYFRKVDGSYVETSKAKPGEDVYARVYVNTSFNVYAIQFYMFFEKDILEYKLKTDGLDTTDIKNPDLDYINAITAAEFTSPTTAGAYKTAVKKGYISDATAVKYGYKDLDDMNSNVSAITVVADYPTTLETYVPLTSDKYLCEIPFKVKAETDLGDKDTSDIVIPIEFFATIDNDNAYSNVAMYTGDDDNEFAYLEDFDEDPNIATSGASISVNGDIIYDANEGKFADDKTTQTESGIIGTDATKPSDPTRKKYTFKGWAKSKTATAADDLSAVDFDYDDQTFYAVWEAKPAGDVNYNVNIYKMGLDGKYPDTAETTQQTGKDGASINYTPDTLTGFTLDTESSVLTGTLDEESDTTLNINVYYKRNQHSVIYKNEKGEELQKTENVYYGAQIPALENEYNVPGNNVSWTSSPENVTTMPDSDVVYTAKLEAITYTYTYTAADTTTGQTGKFSNDTAGWVDTYKYNETATDPQAELTAPAGYKFKEWSPAIVSTVTEDQTYEARYEAIPYTVTYEVKDAPAGVNAPAAKQNVYVGDKFSVENLPVVGDGYSIDGWYNGETKVEAGSEFTMPAENVTLTAKVTTKTFKVNFDADGGDPVESINVEYGKSLDTLPTTTKDDNDFTGWVDASTGESVTSIASMPANDVNLKATWARKEYSITYKYTNEAPEGAAAVPEASKSISGATITVENAPEFEGWTFDGWKFNGTKVDSFTMPTNDVELTGSWKKNGGNLSFYLAKNEDGTPAGDPISTQWVDEGGSIVTPDDPSKTGWTFIKWVDEDGNDLPATMPNADVNAFASFEINKHNVTYYDSDGTTVLASYTDVPYASEVPQPDTPTPPTHSDELYEYYFAHWTPSVPAEMPDSELTFVATYGERLKGADHTVTFKSGNKVIDAKVVHAGEPIEVPADPEKFGSKFVGWDPEVPAVMPDYDITFEAQWETNLDFNPVIIGGVVVAGAAVAAIAAANTALITGAAIVGGVVVLVGVHHVIEHSYNVTYKVNGEVYRTFRVIEGTKVIVPKDPTKEGAEFEGWTPEVPDKMPAEDLVFEAVWSDSDVDNPATGSTSVGLAAFAAISTAAVAAFLATKKKKEDEE